MGRPKGDSSITQMRLEGGEAFLPVHDVFGGQTGIEAANIPDLFRNAYDSSAYYTGSRLARIYATYYTDASATTQAVWDKDWGAVAPRNGNGQYVVGPIADWLWRRIVGDGGKNFDPIARAQVIAILARGWDFGYAVTSIDPSISTDPEMTYTSDELTTDQALVDIIDSLAAETMQLDSPNITGARRVANNRLTYAANFIAALPYTFALEGK